MGKYIAADTLKQQIENPYTEYPVMIQIRKAIKEFIDSAPSIDIVRCKECKHRPIKEDPDGEDYGFNLIEPNDEDDRCPCLVDDGWYSWLPNDDFYCGYGERKEESIIEVYNGNADKENWQCITIKPIEDESQTEDDKKHCVFCKWVCEPNVCGRCRNMNLFANAIEDEPQTKRPTRCSECKVWHQCFKEKPSYNMIKSRCPIDEPQKHCHRPSDVACHPEQGDTWCRGCDYWYVNEPQTERSE